MSCLLYTYLFAIIVNVYSASVTDQKPFDCTPNEVYYKCNLEVCYQKCQHLAKPPPCPALSPDCYAPACVCKHGYLRNDKGSCVPIADCDNNN